MTAEEKKQYQANTKKKNDARKQKAETKNLCIGCMKVAPEENSTRCAPCTVEMARKAVSWHS